MKKKYTFDEFVEIIRQLRSENGCPWDREQTHESLKPCMTEEAAELLAAIRIYTKTGNCENMCEELGDIILQAVMHSQIADEEGLFTIDDVISEISLKMIRRHPHVFGSVQADNSEQVLSNWEEIKKKEKEGKEWIASPLQEIPEELPSLARACKVIKKADKLYGGMCSEHELYENLKQQVINLEKENSEEKEKKIVTQILWNLSDYARRKKISLEQIFQDEIQNRIEKYEQNLQEQ